MLRKVLFPIARFLKGLLLAAPAPATLMRFKAALLPSNVNPSTRIVSSLAIAVPSGTMEMSTPFPVKIAIAPSGAY